MQKIGPSLVLSLAFLLQAGATSAETLYVAPGGDDSWSGRLAEPAPSGKDGPLRSLEGARDAIRRLKEPGGLREPVRVVVRRGTYKLEAPFVLEPRDSGTQEAPISYSGEPGARPVVSGGRPITGWKKEGPLWIADLPGVRAGSWRFGALWVNGERRRRARTPNEGWFHTAGKAAPAKDTAGKEVVRERNAFRFRPGDIQSWRNLADAIVVVYHSWETSIHRVASIEHDTSTVVFTGPAPWPFEKWGPSQRYHVENIPEALDAPGEWYLDRGTGRLSYYPMPDEDLGSAEVIAPVAAQLVVLRGVPAAGGFVEHVSFEDLSFLHTEWSPPPGGHGDSQAASSIPGAIEAAGARHCSFIRLEAAHTGTYGLWLRAGSQDCRVEQCHVHDLGAGGVRLGEVRDASVEAERAERNVVVNCFIHDGGKIFPGGVGVWIGRSSHNTISHNDIGDFDYTGVSVGWSWGFDPSSAHHNVIEHNHIHDIGRGVLNDMGAIYTLGVSPGTVERHNHIHDIWCHGFGGWGVYTDEGSSGILIEKNIVYNTSSGCFHQHYGKENVLRNNVFAFALEGVLRRSREEEHSSFTFERNIVLSRGSPLHIVSWANGKYTIDSNLYWDYDKPEPLFFGMSFADWRAKGRDLKSIVADPLCADPDRYDFRLAAGSPATRIAFEPIETEGIGLTGDPDWVSLPRRVRRSVYKPPGATGPADAKIEGVISELDKICRERTVYMIGPEKATRLAELLREKKPRRAVECGTALGYSGLWIARELKAAGGGAKLVTIEIDAGRAREAQENFRRAGLDDVAEVRVGDARQAVAELEGGVDFLFLDCNFENYWPCFQAIEGKLEDGALIVADNAGVGASAMAEYLGHVRSRHRSRTEWFDMDLPWGKRDAMEVTTYGRKKQEP